MKASRHDYAKARKQEGMKARRRGGEKG